MRSRITSSYGYGLNPDRASETIQQKVERDIQAKIVQLEVTGEAYFDSEWQFRELKRRTEAGNSPRFPQYSVRKCSDHPFKCETYVVE